MSEYKLKTGPIGEKVVDSYKKVEGAFVEKFLQKDETSASGYTLKTGKTAEDVVSAYKKIEDGVVGSYKKIEDAFVDKFLDKVDEEEEQ